MKRSSLVMSFVAALVLSTPVWSVGENDGVKNPANHSGAADSHGSKEKYDANHDGKLDDAERATMNAEKAAAKAKKEAEHQAKLLAKYDANKNGTLDPEEEAKWKADDEAAKAKRKEKAAAKAAEKAKEHGEHAEGEAH